jgi:hypothetical protein
VVEGVGLVRQSRHQIRTAPAVHVEPLRERGAQGPRGFAGLDDDDLGTVSEFAGEPVGIDPGTGLAHRRRQGDDRRVRDSASSVSRAKTSASEGSMLRRIAVTCRSKGSRVPRTASPLR